MFLAQASSAAAEHVFSLNNSFSSQQEFALEEYVLCTIIEIRNIFCPCKFYNMLLCKRFIIICDVANKKNGLNWKENR